MKLAVIGSGYVGLVTGTCLARFGNTVVCVDSDQRRVEALTRGEVPFYEPGLSDMMKRNAVEGRLSFSSDTRASLNGSDMCFITVGTPSAPDGSADLSYIEAASREIGRFLKNNDYNRKLLVVVKSTVPVGTNERVRQWIAEEGGQEGAFETASNPEFLREGAAVRDFVEPDRVVIGTASQEAALRMGELYSFTEPQRLLFMDIRSAEMAKYASNAMLATRISFMNEMASICERVGADVECVRQAMSLDTRIGSKFLYAGCGYGGSCFPKDVRAIRDFAAAAGYDARILTAVDEVNESQKEVLFGKVAERFGTRLDGLNAAVWGLAFKPKTSDVREAPSLTLIRRLLDAGAHVRAHDPRAADEVRSALGQHDGLVYVSDPYDALADADALVVVTEWDVYRQPDFDRVKRLMRTPVIVDGRNIYSPAEMERLGFDHMPIGRSVKKVQ
ncbi:MAG: UDP-glucose/GDP-mannose dehydrogenase family protein [Synergistaceae bacterium]|jgi:UDPglucose 6-dehydrogenase|nr:UDP-glucose/GDP-mannose dehydrogenase family protein [Synergistaceae bacterium]